MRCPTLRRDVAGGCGLRTLFGADEEQRNSADQRQATEYWRNGNVLVLLGGRVDRPEIENFFLAGIAKSLIGESQCAKNN